jgi:hypothetical protein
VSPEIIVSLVGAFGLVGLVVLIAWEIAGIRRTYAAFERMTVALGLTSIRHAASVWLGIAATARYVLFPNDKVLPRLRRSLLARGNRGDLTVELQFARRTRNRPDCTTAIVAAPGAVPAAAFFTLDRSGLGLYGLFATKVSLPAFGSGYVWSEKERAVVERVPAHIWEMLVSLSREVLLVQASPGMFLIQWKGREDDPAIIERAFLVGAEGAGGQAMGVNRA